MENEILWTSGFINERLPAPISPLGWSHIGPFIEELALRDPLRCLGYPQAETIPLTRLWRGHPYVNARAFHIFYKVFPDFLLPEDAYRYFPDGDVSIRKRAPYPHWRDAPRVAFAMLRAFLSDPFNVSPLTNYRHWARHTRAQDALIAALRARVDALADAAPGDIFAALRDVERAHRQVLRIHRWSLTDADLTFGLLKRLVAAWIDRAHANEIAAQLVADVPNKTLEVDAALGEIGNWKLETFLAEHGHRSFSLDIAIPTFAEEPAQIERLIQSGKPMPSSKFSVFSVQLSGARRWLFNAVLSLAREYVRLREDQRYYWQKSLAVARRLYLMLADRLVADGVIAERAAVFYATHQELAEYFEGRVTQDKVARVIAARREEWRVYEREFMESPTASYPAFLRGDEPVGNARRSVPRLMAQEWRGRAVSPGIARGIARVVLSASELSRVQRGEILVAPATDPAWTPVFARIAGLIVERGGVLSHSAVVAREYRVPAVAGIAGIVDAIRDGDVIEVDGNAGMVKRA